uniref:F-box protein CPR1-like n=1 Tax=Erigeron canadensis TaxID=72917 RepID=UPI001CB8F3B3|nr:F-box protein CPR1-like [Erigeron canadensis]
MRCVSRLFYALLSQPGFIKTHLIHSTQNHKKDDEIVLVFNHANKDKPFTAHLLKSPEIQVNHLIKLPHNFPSPDSFNKYDSCIFGSVNGLICFYTTLSCRFRPRFIHIWNPSLSALVTLPGPKPNVYPIEYCRFGYDPKTDDYKVVKLSYDFLTDLVEVYSMKKHSWKSVKEKFPSNNIESEIVLFNEVCIDSHDGHVHWLRRHVVDDLDNFFLEIIAFDLGTETFSLISLPNSISNLDWGYIYGSNNLSFGYWAGKLCVMAHVGHDEFDEFEVWVMNEYGVAESWVKHHNFSSKFSGTHIDPIGFTLDNKFLYGVGSHLASYDPDTTQVASFSSYSRRSVCTKVVHYIDSLIWVAPRKKYASTRCKKDGIRKIPKKRQSLIIYRKLKEIQRRTKLQHLARHYWHG